MQGANKAVSWCNAVKRERKKALADAIVHKRCSLRTQGSSEVIELIVKPVALVCCTLAEMLTQLKGEKSSPLLVHKDIKLKKTPLLSISE